MKIKIVDSKFDIIFHKLRVKNKDKMECIFDVRDHMLRYQRENKTKGKCLTNTQTLYDISKYFSKDTKIEAKAFICIGKRTKDGRNKLVDKHMALVSNGKIIDSSYEVHSLKELKYYRTYREFMDCEFFKELGGFNENNLKSFLNFVEHSKDMNNGDFVVTVDSEEYYDNQLKYLGI